MFKILAVVVLLIGLIHSTLSHAVVETAGKVESYSADEGYIVINGSRYQLADSVEILLPNESKQEGLFVGASVRIEFSDVKVHRIYIEQ